MRNGNPFLAPEGTWENLSRKQLLCYVGITIAICIIISILAYYWVI
jgi:hypothetical protein